VVITDDFSRYRWAFPIAVKGDAHQTITDFIKWSKLYCSPFQVISIRIDQGTEFGIRSLQLFCKENGIDLEYSATYTPEQNGVAKALNKVILTKARIMMLDSGLPQYI
jgi:transposase InsO family protein